MRRIIATFLLVFLAAAVTYSQVTITNTTIYRTANEMLLANELNESGEPYAEAIGYNLDLLDPFKLNLPDSI